MSDQIDRLREDIRCLERARNICENNGAVVGEIDIKIGEAMQGVMKLEAEADPWRRAKSAVEYFRGFAGHKQAEHDVVAYVDHLEAENAAKAKRIDDLESRPVPPLDRKRVIATACKVIAKENHGWAIVIKTFYQAGDAGIYPLADESEGGK